MALRAPQVAGSEDGLFDDRGAMLLETIQHLPALAELSISFKGYADSLVWPVSDAHGLPHCQQLAALHSRSLTRLDVQMRGGPVEGNTLRLVDLRELRSCTLRGFTGRPANICLDATSFQGAPKLQDLQLQDGSLQQLTALTALSLSGCGLRSVPAGVASFSATLCVLDLSDNGPLQVDAAAVDSLCGCSQLQILGLYKNDILEWKDVLGHAAWPVVQRQMDQQGYVPAQFSSESVVQLMRLPSVFRERHGRDLVFK